MKGKVNNIDKFDLIIKQELSKNIDLPASYENTIKNALNKENTVKNTMQNKFLKLATVMCLVILVPVVVLGTKELLMYNEDGKVMIFGEEPLPEGISPENAVIVVQPSSYNNTYNTELKKEKENFEKENANIVNSEDNTVVSDNKEIDESLANQDKKEKDVIRVLSKYYDSSEIKQLFDDLSIKMKNVSGSLVNDYTIPEEGIKLIKYMFEIIEEKSSSSNEKEILIKYLKSISSYGIRNDETLKNKLEDLYEK